MIKTFKSPDRVTFKAFSLVEMLMALLVASLLMAALAPVITKKVNETSIDIRYGTDENGVERKVCASINDTFENIVSEDCTVPENAQFGSAIIVSGGGGGSGAIDSAKSSEKVLTYEGISGASNNTTQTQYTFTFNKDINTMQLRMAAGGGGGGGGNYGIAPALGKPRQKGDCAGIYGNDTHNFVTAKGNYAVFDSKNNICVTKFNQIQDESLTNPKGIMCFTNYPHSACSNDQKSMSYAYSGCQRATCSYEASVNACISLTNKTGLSWRLPNKSETEKWNTADSWKELALCSNTTDNTTVAYCGNSDQNLAVAAGYYSSDTYAWPYYLWIADYNQFLLSDSASTRYGWGTHRVMSTRCVSDKVQLIDTYIGGGGGGSSFAYIDIPKEVIQYATKNNGVGTIRMYVGAGGKGGVKQGGTAGVNGSPTKVEIYAPDDSVPIWSYQLSAGRAGGNATTSSGGSGGYGPQVYDGKWCKFRHRSVAGGTYETETDVICREVANANVCNGQHGVAGSASETAGYGGRACTQNNSNPGKEYMQLVNTSGTIGNGGGGGICTLNEDATVSCTNGGNGGAGAVYIYYTTKAPGVGGSGGGAGGLLHIVNFKTTPKAAIKIQAGKRGKGGTSGAAGLDGGESYIEADGKKYSVSGGKGGCSGIAGIPPADNKSNATLPIAGAAGAGGGSTASMGTKFNGEAGTKSIISNTESSVFSAGGNGGVNPKIALFSDIPCGGLSTTSILGAACNRVSNIPTPLTRTLLSEDFNSAFKSVYGPGATGGGGGGWNSNLSEGSTAAPGADGLGGYVFIYFGSW